MFCEVVQFVLISERVRTERCVSHSVLCVSVFVCLLILCNVVDVLFDARGCFLIELKLLSVVHAIIETIQGL